MAERDDDAVSRRYRELPAEEPPRALDETILAAARRAANARPAPLVAPTGRQRWYVPLAAAAVIVLAVGLTLRVQLEQPPEESVRLAERKAEAPVQAKKDVARLQVEDKSGERPAPERRARQVAQPQSRDELPKPFLQDRAAREAPAASRPSADTRAEAQGTLGAGAARAPESPAVAAVVPAPAAKPAAPPPPALAREAPSAAEAARADDASRNRALASGTTAKRLQEAEETPERALERIAELRKGGKHDEADKALAEFRKRYPDYKLSDEMKAKVERSLAR